MDLLYSESECIIYIHVTVASMRMYILHDSIIGFCL